MPLYQYNCPECGFEFEKFCSVKDRDSQDCSQCGTLAVKQLANSFAVASKVDVDRGGVHSAKEIDKVVGEQAEKRWAEIDQSRKDRWKDSGLDEGKTKVVVEKGVNFNPIAMIGASDKQDLGNKYSEGLQAHRAERRAKGQEQFTTDTKSLRKI